ncbi:hypothetical protein CRYUN_Cryun17cG0052400 [Craigia yunnanensis]
MVFPSSFESTVKSKGTHYNLGKRLLRTLGFGYSTLGIEAFVTFMVVDLYVMLSSFLPKDGHIMLVAVYPSEFGLRRMKEEEIHGPVGLFEGKHDENDEDGDDEIDNEKLRAYERSRLR